MSPPGRYAHWVNWEIWGFSKESWQAIHTVFSYTFVILSVFHLFTINWKVFLSYFKKKSRLQTAIHTVLAAFRTSSGHRQKPVGN